jgi:cobalamin biosynthesis Mg chelatase CobN
VGQSGSAPESTAPGGEPVAAAPDAAEPVLAARASVSTEAPGGPPVAALAGFGLVVGLGGAAWWRMRGER